MIPHSPPPTVKRPRRAASEETEPGSAYQPPIGSNQPSEQVLGSPLLLFSPMEECSQSETINDEATGNDNAGINEDNSGIAVNSSAASSKSDTQVVSLVRRRKPRKKTHYKLKYGQKERKTMLQKASRQIKSNEKLQEANKKLKEELKSIPTRLRSTVKEVIQDAENGDITGAFLLDQVRTSFMVCLATAFV